MQKYCNSVCHHPPWLTVHQESEHIQETCTGCAIHLTVSKIFAELPGAKFSNAYRYLTAGMSWNAALIRNLQNIHNNASANCLVAPATGLSPLPLCLQLNHVVHSSFWCFFTLCWSFTFTSLSFKFLITLHLTTPGLPLWRVFISQECRLNASSSLSSVYHVVVGTQSGPQDSHWPCRWERLLSNLQKIIWACRLERYHWQKLNQHMIAKDLTSSVKNK